VDVSYRCGALFSPRRILFALGVTARVQIVCISTPIKVLRVSRAQRQIFSIYYNWSSKLPFINVIGGRNFRGTMSLNVIAIAAAAQAAKAAKTLFTWLFNPIHP
jgi:hypothetical protein